jgi:hypothetical protein
VSLTVHAITLNASKTGPSIAYVLMRTPLMYS